MKFKLKKKKSKQGFTLIEQLVTVTISSLLLLGATQVFISTQKINKKITDDRVISTNNQLLKDKLSKIIKNSVYCYQYVDLSQPNTTISPIDPIVRPMITEPDDNNNPIPIPVVFSPDNTRNETSDITSLDLPYIKNHNGAAYLPTDVQIGGNVLMFVTSELKPLKEIISGANFDVSKTLLGSDVKNYLYESSALATSPTIAPNSATNLTPNQQDAIINSKVVILTINCLYLRNMRSKNFDSSLDQTLNSTAQELVWYKKSNLYRIQPDMGDLSNTKNVVLAYTEQLNGSIGEIGADFTNNYNVAQENASINSRIYESKVLQSITYHLTANGYRGWGALGTDNKSLFHGGFYKINPFDTAILDSGGTRIQEIIALPPTIGPITSPPTVIINNIPSETRVLATYIAPPPYTVLSGVSPKVFSYDFYDVSVGGTVASPVTHSVTYASSRTDIHGIKVNLQYKKVLPNQNTQNYSNYFTVDLPKLLH